MQSASVNLTLTGLMKLSELYNLQLVEMNKMQKKCQSAPLIHLELFALL